MQNTTKNPYNETPYQKQTRINTEQSRTSLYTQQAIQSIIPFQILNFLGLNKIFMNNLVFKRRSQKYSIRQIKNKNIIVGNNAYQLPSRFSYQVQILEYGNSSVPICRFRPTEVSNHNIIIYAHGNGTDLVDTLQNMQKISQNLGMEFIVFDYTGYGCSRKKDITQETVRQDLEIVLAWITQTIPLQNIILWGFSLGTYPVCYCADKYRVKAVILQSPFASIANLFREENIDISTKIKDDFLVNLEHIHRIKTQILIIHSKADQLIPFQHSMALMRKYEKYNKQNRLQFVEVDMIDHNQMHQFFSTDIENCLKTELLKWIDRISSTPFKSSIFDQHYQYEKTARFPNNQQKKANQQQPRDHKIKLVSGLVYPRKVNQLKSLTVIASSLQLVTVPQQGYDVEEIQVVDGIIVKKYTTKRKDGCFCIQNW